MEKKEPVLLVVYVETATLRWYVAGVDLNGTAIPLLCSAEGNLSPYVGKEMNEQLSFLRHRFSGVLQSGCDRLWQRRKKPVHIVFATDGPFVPAPPDLTQKVAEHMVEWMWNPPVVFFVLDESTNLSSLTPTAGDIPDDHRTALISGLPQICDLMRKSDVWELAPAKKKYGG